MSIFSEQTRIVTASLDDRRDAGLKQPEDVVCVKDIVYGRDPEYQSLDIYRPKNRKNTKLPVIISVHGGGWIYGDKERYAFYCMSLARQGFAVVNFSYRLAPEYKFPACMEDMNQVCAWVMKHGEKYELDIHHIFAVGDSAGANILSLYTDILTNAEFAKKFSFQTPPGFCMKALALNCGVYHIVPERKREENLLPLMKELFAGEGKKEELDTIDVLRYMNQDFPATYVMTCSGDFVRMQSADLVERLTELEIPFQAQFWGDSKKALNHVFHLNLHLEEANRCSQEECRFFWQILNQEDSQQ